MFKRPNLIAALVRLNVLKEPTSDAERLALDAQLAGFTAQDAMAVCDEDMEDDPENPGKKRKKLNPGKGEPTKAGGALAGDAATIDKLVSDGITVALADQLKAGHYVTAATAQQMANDAAAEAVRRVEALAIARKDVEPLVGVVAMDSAEAVYRYALEQEKVALDGVHPSAFRTLVQSRVQLKTAGAKPSGGGGGVDTLGAVHAALPGLGSVSVI